MTAVWLIALRLGWEEECQVWSNQRKCQNGTIYMLESGNYTKL